jgi:hypothetical protein
MRREGQLRTSEKPFTKASPKRPAKKMGDVVGGPKIDFGMGKTGKIGYKGSKGMKKRGKSY